MLEAGWLAEVRGLLAAGVAEDARYLILSDTGRCWRWRGGH